MRFRKFILWAAIIAAGLVAILLIASVVVIAMEVTINLEAFKDDIEAAATKALGRQVNIDGIIKLVPALWPTVEIQGFRIANPPGWESENFVRIAAFRANIGILPLLQRKIHIEEITGDGIDIRLEAKPDGQKNWIFKKDQGPGSIPKETSESSNGISIAFVEVEELSLYHLNVDYLDSEADQHYEFNLEKLDGQAVADEPLELSMQGAFQKQRYYISVKGDPVAGLFAPKEPWYLQASAEMAGATLNVNGKLDDPLQGKGFDFAFNLSGDRLRAIEQLVGTPLPQIGVYGLSGRLAETQSGYSLSNLKAKIGETDIAGDINANLSEDKPHITAVLKIDTIDAGAFSAESQGNAESETSNPNDSKSESLQLDDLIFSLDILQQIEADIELSIDEVVNTAADIRNFDLKLAIHEGRLTAPMAVTYADVALRGTVDAYTQNEIPVMKIALQAEQTDLGNLAKVLAGAEGIKGHLNKFEINLSSQGNNLQSIIKHLDLMFVIENAALSYGHDTPGKPVSFSLDSTKIALAAGQRMTVDATGKLLDEPFKIRFNGGSLDEYIAGHPWPLDLFAGGGGAKLTLKGIIAPSTDSRGSYFKLQLSGDRISGLSTWLGVSPAAKMSYSAGGQIKLTANGWEMNSLKAHIGKTKLSGELGWKGPVEKSLFSAKLRLADVVVDELERIFEADAPETKKETNSQGATIDMPIFPQQVAINDADIDIAISRINLQPFDITDVSFSSRIRNGFVDQAPFQAAIGNVTFKGAFGLDLRGKIPETKLEVNSSQVDIGNLLQTMNIAEKIDSTVGRLGVKLLAKGHNLSTMLDQSEFKAGMKDGKWILHDPSTKAGLEIQINEGFIRAPPGQPVVLTLDSRIRETPFKIKIETDKLKSFVDHPDKIPLNLKIEGIGVNIGLRSTVTLPIDRRTDQTLSLSLSGERLDSVNKFLDMDLPPFGPYALEGRFDQKESGYYLSDLNVRVSNSEMIGSASLETQGQRPQLNVDLTTKILQINDFKLGDWSLVEGEANETEDGYDVNALLSPEVMRFLNARLSLRVEEVLSGEDKLGSGTFKATLQDGRLVVDPLQLDLPGGSAIVTFAFEPTETDVALEVATRIEQFDYGILARRIKPQSNMNGWLSLDLELKSTAKSLDAIMENAGGYIDFAIVPEDFEAGIFELWAVNLLAAALTQVDSESKSVINCMVFRLNLEEGRVKQEAILVDTTNMQVAGEVKVDFETEKIYMVLDPRAKKPEFFSLATPLKVEGTFKDFDVGVKPGGLVGTAIRFITSPVHVPIRRLFKEKTPTDGKSACAEAMHRPHD
jgi:uncharacterized protein involved in outer membrane biogenesis